MLLQQENQVWNVLNLIKKSKASLVGFASIIDRSTKKSLKIKKKLFHI